MYLRFGAATVALLGLLALLPATPALAFANFSDEPQGLADLDARTGTVAPTAAQKQVENSGSGPLPGNCRPNAMAWCSQPRSAASSSKKT